MRFLITGASGYLGTKIIESWPKDTVSFAVSRSRPAKMKPDDNRWLARPVALDRKLKNLDIVLHLEVKQHVENPGIPDLREFENVNIAGTKAWLDWSDRNGVANFIYVSSIKAVSAGTGPTSEEAEGPANTPYGASKWAGEQLVRTWAKADAGRSALILRPAVIYGPDARGNMRAMYEAIRRRRFFLIGPNTNIKSIVSVGNVLSSIAFLAKQMKPGCEVFNVTDAETMSVREIDRRMRQVLGRTGNSPTIPMALAEVCASFGDVYEKFTDRGFVFNRYRLRALLEHTNFSCSKLLSAGFKHPESGLTKI